MASQADDAEDTSPKHAGAIGSSFHAYAPGRAAAVGHVIATHPAAATLRNDAVHDVHDPTEDAHALPPAPAAAPAPPVPAPSIAIPLPSIPGPPLASIGEERSQYGPSRSRQNSVHAAPPSRPPATSVPPLIQPSIPPVSTAAAAPPVSAASSSVGSTVDSHAGTEGGLEPSLHPTLTSTTLASSTSKLHVDVDRTTPAKPSLLARASSWGSSSAPTSPALAAASARVRALRESMRPAGGGVSDPFHATGVPASLHVAKEDFRFNAAHFVLHQGGREKLHGHNYHVSLSCEGTINSDGYVVDFSLLKAAVRHVCAHLHERFLLPTRCEHLTHVVSEDSVHMTLRDGAHFMFPREDVVLLPIRNSTCEELALYVAMCILHRVGTAELLEKGVEVICVGVAETANQEARVTMRVADAALRLAGSDAAFASMMEAAAPVKRPAHAAHE